MKKPLSEKHARLYLKVARTLADPEHNSCLSRSIGAVIVKPDVPGGRIVSTGYNGPAAHLPRPDSEDHLRNVVWPQLTGDDILRLGYDEKNETSREDFVEKCSGCGHCPRKLVGAKSGQRLELCGCAHAERNAIDRATENLTGCTMFCWCGVPCYDCCTAIINSGINYVVCINWGFDYSPQSKWKLLRAGVTIEVRDPETLEVADFFYRQTGTEHAGRF